MPVEDQEKDEIIKDVNLVVQIEKKFYSFETGAPKLVDYGQAQVEQEALEAEARKHKRIASLTDLRQQQDIPDPIVQAWYHDSECKGGECKCHMKVNAEDNLLSEDEGDEIEEESEKDEAN